MTAAQCRDRAFTCTSLAGLAISGELRAQYLDLAAQWRLMSLEALYFGQPANPVANPGQ